jgi:hypothetical protein
LKTSTFESDAESEDISELGFKAEAPVDDSSADTSFSLKHTHGASGDTFIVMVENNDFDDKCKSMVKSSNSDAIGITFQGRTSSELNSIVVCKELAIASNTWRYLIFKSVNGLK